MRTRAELAVALGEASMVSGTVASTRALVMTMGALHEGHLALVRAARQVADTVVVSIFVNPLQFGPGEDYERYPRTLDADVALLSEVGVEIVFAPDRDEMYPGGDPTVSVTAGTPGGILEGASRPGHFDGVLTVVLKVIHLVRPDVAIFGEKDAQQILLVRRMVEDLAVPVRIQGVPIVRDDDGLALSSRNAYLSADERQAALALSRGLRAGRDVADEGGSPAEVLAAARGMLDRSAGVVTDYVELLDTATVEVVPESHAGQALLLVAARVGATRLIDNMAVSLSARPGRGTSGGTQ
ncbi:pantoate--beta-alanine ligase [Sanguibacter antarcticus]|uniref:pantoate--beta-alanine ligase n=1 Tax=Sanguibacter antarcticus TaxID=372484 RepID=UPI000BF3C9D9